jgi:hypothetical protein
MHRFLSNNWTTSAILHNIETQRTRNFCESDVCNVNPKSNSSRFTRSIILHFVSRHFIGTVRKAWHIYAYINFTAKQITTLHRQ